MLRINKSQNKFIETFLSNNLDHLIILAPSIKLKIYSSKVMQKHQQWLENRSYQHHLHCLKKIKSRVKPSTDYLPKRKNQHSISRMRQARTTKDQKDDQGQKQNRVSTMFLPTHQQQSQALENFPIENQNDIKKSAKKEKLFILRPKTRDNLTSRNHLMFSARNHHNTHSQDLRKFNSPQPQIIEAKSPQNISLKEQELIWNNFLLGKRIIQTNPVISKKKHDEEYRKHKQLLKSRTTRKLDKEPSQFRLRSIFLTIPRTKGFQSVSIPDLRQPSYSESYSQKIYAKSQNRKQLLPNILDISVLKFKLSAFQDILLTMKYGENQEKSQNLKPKKTKQVSQIISSAELTFHNFFFTLKRQKIMNGAPIVIQMKNVKGLSVVSFGTFSFKFGSETHQITNQQANLYSFGKLIGCVTFTAKCGKKHEFISNLL